jgi:hypothetical protein
VELPDLPAGSDSSEAPQTGLWNIIVIVGQWHEGATG